MSSKSVPQKCQIWVSSKSVLPERCAIVSSKGVLQECRLNVSSQGVSQVGSLEKLENVTNKLLSLFLNIPVGIRVRGLHLVGWTSWLSMLIMLFLPFFLVDFGVAHLGASLGWCGYGTSAQPPRPCSWSFFFFWKDMRTKKDWDSYVIITIFVDCSGNYLCIFVRLGHATPHNTPRISIFDFGLVTNGNWQVLQSKVMMFSNQIAEIVRSSINGLRLAVWRHLRQTDHQRESKQLVVTFGSLPNQLLIKVKGLYRYEMNVESCQTNFQTPYKAPQLLCKATPIIILYLCCHDIWL